MSLSSLRWSVCVAFALVLLGAGIAANVSAATVGYWRFENDPGYLQDSSGNGHTITGLTGQTAIPGAGDGSAFLNPVPQTFAANAH